MLFDHIAACLADYMREQNLTSHSKMPLGFTFSFPCQQNGLTNAVLTNWTKGFTASGVVGENVVYMLRDAFKRRGDVDIDVVALLNDTTGTMLACSFIEQHCYVGVIVGTGCNAAYMERLENVPKLKGIVNSAEVTSLISSNGTTESSEEDSQKEFEPLGHTIRTGREQPFGHRLTIRRIGTFIGRKSRENSVIERDKANGWTIVEK
ncbi:hypothetical protein niasHT_019133 [Heterodera trifolii]|uniref:Phosphotransferase n=1 Tax=Heterodera trifolii TaxID=157864 RepID=A0ABD2KYK9_9BILA